MDDLGVRSNLLRVADRGRAFLRGGNVGPFRTLDSDGLHFWERQMHWLHREGLFACGLEAAFTFREGQMPSPNELH